MCQKKGCGECVDDRFKPLLEFEYLDKLDFNMLAKLRELGWTPDLGSPLEYFDEDGDSLLHSAARRGDAQVVEKLLELGAEANTCCQGECCCSPLMVACRWCHADCACSLLRSRADTNFENSFGETARDQVVNRCMGTEEQKKHILSLI